MWDDWFCYEWYFSEPKKKSTSIIAGMFEILFQLCKFILLVPIYGAVLIFIFFWNIIKLIFK